LDRFKIEQSFGYWVHTEMTKAERKSSWTKYLLEDCAKLEGSAEECDVFFEISKTSDQEKDVKALETIARIASARREIETSFAWIVAPRDEQADGRTRHIAMSLPLSAIVSVPSWWGALQIEVTTCWIRPSKIRDQMEPDSLCKNVKGAETQTIDLPLPGGAQDVLQKLGFYIVRTPYLDSGQGTIGLFEAGRKAEILLTGARLWKNPRVRLGGQWHDSIEVLPDMQGLIATFECVAPTDFQQPIALFGEGQQLTFGQPAQRESPAPNQPQSGNKKKEKKEGKKHGGPPPNQPQSGNKKEEKKGGKKHGGPPPFEERPVQVWTSEGVTSPSVVRINSFRPRYILDGAPEKPCWLDLKDKREEEALKGKAPEDRSPSQNPEK
jgi:hypothetical protein